jgi:hypothetical protein
MYQDEASCDVAHSPFSLQTEKHLQKYWYQRSAYFRSVHPASSHFTLVSHTDSLLVPPPPPPQPPTLSASLCSRFDDGCYIDREGFFSVTHESLARHHAERCRSLVTLVSRASHRQSPPRPPSLSLYPLPLPSDATSQWMQLQVIQ